MARQSPSRPEEDDPISYQRRLNIRMTLHGLAILYLLWLVFDLVRQYRQGGSGVELSTVVITAAAFLAACVIIGLLTWRMWKRGKARMQRMWEQQDRVQDDPADDGEEEP